MQSRNSTWLDLEYAVQMGGGWGMNLSLQDVLKRGHEPGARRGAGLQQSMTSEQSPVGVVQWSKSSEGGGGGRNRKQKGC